MQVSRMIAGTKLGYRYQLSLNAIDEPTIQAIETLGDTLSNLSQVTFAWAFVRFPEYLDPDAAQHLASLLNGNWENARISITVDANPISEYALHPDLLPFRNGTSSRSLKEDYQLKQRQIKALQQQISTIHHTIPGFRVNHSSNYGTSLDPDLRIGDCTPQDLWAALMLNSGFNLFDPYQVVDDLYAHRQLWLGFAMLPDIEVMTSDRPNLRRRGYVSFLTSLSDRHHCDCLYVAAADDDATLPLLDFGKEWKADDVQVYTGEAAERLLNDYDCPSPVLRYWWD